MSHSLPSGSASTKEDVRQRRTREALHRTMLAAIAAKPLGDVTVREITAGAGIAYATFFRHYANKEALLEQVAANEIRRLVTLTLPVLDEGDARGSCQALCRTIDADRLLWRALLSGSTRNIIHQELLRISLSVAQTRSPAWPPVEVSTAVAVGAIIEILGWWLGQAAPAAADQVADLLFERAVAPGIKDIRT